MSVFKGSVAEYPGVIVDHFSPSNCRRGRAFFLSHCHKDHMTGLDSQDLLRALREKSIRLYCSEVTKALLTACPGFRHLDPFLEPLPVEDPVCMKLDALRDEKALQFTLTLLPAGHCPGSVMFLFQGENGNVLYTGDFRLTVEETKKIAILHEGDKTICLKTLYLDTTFCHPRAENIACRDKTREVIIEIANSWLQRSPSNYLHLLCSSYGYEHILIAVAQHFKTRIHMNGWRRRAYSTLPSVAQYLTADGMDTRIHACSFRGGAPCNVLGHSNQQVLRIKPSTQWFLQRGSIRVDEPYVFLPERNMVRVMHSMHASFAELQAFVAYLQPESIVPCVIPSSLGDSSLTDLHVRLRHFLRKRETMTAPPTDKTHHSVQHSLVSERGLSRCKWPKVVGNESSQSDNPSTDDEYASSDGEQTSVDRTFSLPSLSVTGSARRLPSMIPSQHQFLNSQMLYSGPVLSGLGFSKPEQPAIDLSFSQSSSNSTVHNSQTSTDSAEVFPVITPAPKEENVLAAGPTLDNQTVAATDVTLVSGDSKKEEKVLECKKKKGNESRTANRDLADSDRYLKDLKRKREGTHSEHNSFPLPKRAKVEESGIHFPPSWEIIDLTLSSDSDSLTEEDEASTQIESFPIGGVKCEGQCDVNGCGLPFTMHENGPSEKGLRPVQVIKVEVSRTSSSKCVSNKPTPTSAMDDYLVHHSREASPIGGAGLPTLRPCSREATPVGGAGSPPFSPQSLGSPCFLPLTPEKNRETTESILRNNYSFL